MKILLNFKNRSVKRHYYITLYWKECQQVLFTVNGFLFIVSEDNNVSEHCTEQQINGGYMQADMTREVSCCYYYAGWLARHQSQNTYIMMVPINTYHWKRNTLAHYQIAFTTVVGRSAPTRQLDQHNLFSLYTLSWKISFRRK